MRQTDQIRYGLLKFKLPNTKPSLVLVHFIWNRSKIREFSMGLYGTLNGSVFSRASDLKFAHILEAAVYIVWLSLESTSLENDDITLHRSIVHTFHFLFAMIIRVNVVPPEGLLLVKWRFFNKVEI